MVTIGRLHHFFERRCDASPEALALLCGNQQLTYEELDASANRLARYLALQTAGPGSRVGILLERSVPTYVSLLALLKVGAACVPIDPSFPPERMAFLAQDAGLSHVITTSEFTAAVDGWSCSVVDLDRTSSMIARLPDCRLSLPDDGDPLAYIIYTSGSTGKPKGVPISQSSICHFLEVALPIYGVSAEDRVYQGMTIAFDFSIEEIWLSFFAGATLVAGPTDYRRLGPGLVDFLIEHQITVLYCVPTLLATLDRDVPSIHLLIVGGEACPQELVQRWSRPSRRMLNTYGPTETTITATWAELAPDRPVTIGRPLPGYSVQLLDEHLRPVKPGVAGEICIGGAGVACGYLNRPDLTASRFVTNPCSHVPNGRIYRTGDLGRLTSNGEIEYLGRLDSQVKIRGYRIELSEIEAVLLEDREVDNTLVSVRGSDLVAYIVRRHEAEPDQTVRERLHALLCRRLPSYMVPAFIEILDTLPMLASGKADRSRLPAPVMTQQGASATAEAPPTTPLEHELVGAWQAVFGQENLSVEADFFLDLGGHSLFAAMVISRLRQNPALRHLSIADLYANPTIRTLARHIEARPRASAAGSVRAVEPLRHGHRRVLTAGALQFLLLYILFGVLSFPLAMVLPRIHDWPLPLNLAAAFLSLAAMVLLGSLMLPVAAKWLLIGRFRAGVYPLWGWYYCRWWLVQKALALSPMSLLAGSPLLPVYARLLGTRIGRGCHIGTARLHVPDLLEIEDGASIGYDAELQPYVVEGGYLHLAPVWIGAGAFVGAKAVVLADARVGRGARLAEQSLLVSSQTIPNGEDWAGSPAQPLRDSDPLLDAMESRPTPPSAWSPWLLAGYATGAVLLAFLPILALVPGAVLLVWTVVTYGLVWEVAAIPADGLLFVLATCALVAAIKRVAMPQAHAGIYPIHSFFALRKWMADQVIARSLLLTNTLYSTLYTPPWLRLLGARIGQRSEVSTVSHFDPDLLVLRDESFIADMASIGLATFHKGYMALQPTEVGCRTFVGNAAVVQGDTHLGDNSLIGVLTMPRARQVDPGTSWLGSPAMFLPRRQESQPFDETVTFRPSGALVACRLAIEFFRVILPATLLNLAGLLVILVGNLLGGWLGVLPLTAILPTLYLGSALLVTLTIAGLKWLVVGRYRPRVEPLWSHFVWRTELITGLYESAAVPVLLAWLAGTPWLAPLLRLFGARIGRRVYLDTTFLTEFDLVRVGDDAAIGHSTSLQTHLFEDRVMKMSNVTVEPDCSVGCRAVVLYDAQLGAGTSLDALSLVMKGEVLPASSRWQGIPARLVEP